jgi:hypothetical protein
MKNKFNSSKTVKFFFPDNSWKNLFKFKCDIATFTNKDAESILRIEEAACHAIYSSIYRQSNLDISIYDFHLDYRLSNKVKYLLLDNNIDYISKSYYCGLKSTTTIKFGFFLERWRIHNQINQTGNLPLPGNIKFLLNQ